MECRDSCDGMADPVTKEIINCNARINDEIMYTDGYLARGQRSRC